MQANPLAGILNPQTEPALCQIAAAIIGTWAEHEKFLRSSLGAMGSATERSDSESIARNILDICSDQLNHYCTNYRWMCERVLEEELNFRRTGAYRFEKFRDVEAFCYGTPDYMGRYMDGLLLSQVLWHNHCQTISYYQHVFLANSKPNFTQLEIGPGHGLLTALAAANPNCAIVSAWDVSPTSLKKTQACMAKLKVDLKNVKLELRDATEEARGTARFDQIVLSEILEHLEQPREFLESIKSHLGPKGRIFINVPVNSPAPDHIFLLKSFGEATALVESAGLKISARNQFPMSGYTLEKAQQKRATISCVFIAEADENRQADNNLIGAATDRP